jgi:hypothetical protein
MTRSQREEIRIGFFRRHRDESGFASVAVRQAPSGDHYLDVGTTGPVAMESSYSGLPVQVRQVSRSVNAVRISS